MKSSLFLQNDILLEHLLLIFDVDGVIRDSVEASADGHIVEQIKSLLSHPFLHIAFLSGTPVAGDPDLELWRRGNVPLTSVFGTVFEEELAQKKVSIYGMLGGQKMKPGGEVEVLDAYPLEVTFELGRLVLDAFLKEILTSGSAQEQKVAKELGACLNALSLSHLHQPEDATPIEFSDIATTIRSDLDPEFRLISNGATVETHVTSPLYNPARALTFVKEKLQTLSLQEHPHLSRGLAKRGSQDFQFLLLSKSNKKHGSQCIIKDRLKASPHPLIITVGDTQLDFLMHEQAHLAFHVGLEEVWKAHPLPHCILIRGPHGEDKQHVKGTLTLLQLLKEGWGKPFYDFKHIPKSNEEGRWSYYSPRELGLFSCKKTFLDRA